MSRSLRFVIGLLCVAMAMTTGAELTGRRDAAAAQEDATFRAALAKIKAEQEGS